MKKIEEFKVITASCGGWHLPNTALAFERRGSLAGLWITGNKPSLLPVSMYRRCWPFHMAMKPFYHTAPQIVQERAFYAFFPLWKKWLQSQQWPECNVVQAIMGFASEPFDHAEKVGALKVVDCPNSHPTSYYGYWQRECDLWCPGEKVPIPQWMFARMNRELERADVILCPSFFVRDTMILNGLPEEKCFVNPFGVNTEIFKKRERVPLKPRFVAVGTICLRKGFQYLFRAFEIVKRKLPDAELIVVGDYKIDFSHERLKWDRTFTHYSHLSHGELAKVLQTCTAFVFPSQEEGFARVIPEAMGAGLPIIASHESGATTLVDDGVEGFIVRGKDPEHIAQAMIQVSNDHKLNEAMGKAAFKKGALSNTWKDYGERLLAEYQRRLT
jgi:glycosyltransferase involved in cell wall biosynthesis